MSIFFSNSFRIISFLPVLAAKCIAVEPSYIKDKFRNISLNRRYICIHLVSIEKPPQISTHILLKLLRNLSNYWNDCDLLLFNAGKRSWTLVQYHICNYSTGRWNSWNQSISSLLYKIMNRLTDCSDKILGFFNLFLLYLVCCIILFQLNWYYAYRALITN